MEYYCARKRTPALLHPAIWMTLKNTLLKGKKTETKATCCMIPLM